MTRRSWLHVLLLLQLLCSFADAATFNPLPRPLRGSTLSNYDTQLHQVYTPAVNPAFPGKQRRVARASGSPVHVESGLPVIPAWPFWEEDVANAFAADSSGVAGVDVTDQPVSLEAKARRGDEHEHAHAKRTATTAAARRRVQSQTTKLPPTSEQNATTDDTDALNGRASTLLALLLDGYDKQSYPFEQVSGPVPVEINVALHKIISVNLQEGTMDVNAWLRLHWVDPRLAWNATEWGVSKLFVNNPELRYMDIWYPDVTLWNSPYDLANTLGAQAAMLNPGGDVFWGRNGLLRVSCNFRGLVAFPFGPVKCLLEFGTWSHGPLSVIVKEAPQGGATIAGNSMTDMRSAKAVEWKFKSVTSWIHHYPAYPCCPDESNWPVLLVDITLHRTQTLFAIKIIVPQIVLALVGFMTFWLSPESGERLGVAVTIPLALAVYDLIVYSTLPASDDISCIGAIGMLGFLFSVAALGVSVFAIQLYHYREPHFWLGSSTIWAIWLRFRQQRVWTELLQVLDQLETELIKQHLKENSAAKKQRRAMRVSASGGATSKERRNSFMGIPSRSRRSAADLAAELDPSGVGGGALARDEGLVPELDAGHAALKERVTSPARLVGLRISSVTSARTHPDDPLAALGLALGRGRGQGQGQGEMQQQQGQGEDGIAGGGGEGGGGRVRAVGMVAAAASAFAAGAAGRRSRPSRNCMKSAGSISLLGTAASQDRSSAGGGGGGRNGQSRGPSNGNIGGGGGTASSAYDTLDGDALSYAAAAAAAANGGGTEGAETPRLGAPSSDGPYSAFSAGGLRAVSDGNGVPPYRTSKSWGRGAGGGEGTSGGEASGREEEPRRLCAPLFGERSTSPLDGMSGSGGGHVRQERTARGTGGGGGDGDGDGGGPQGGVSPKPPPLAATLSRRLTAEESRLAAVGGDKWIELAIQLKDEEEDEEQQEGDGEREEPARGSRSGTSSAGGGGRSGKVRSPVPAAPPPVAVAAAVRGQSSSGRHASAAAAHQFTVGAGGGGGGLYGSGLSISGSGRVAAEEAALLTKAYSQSFGRSNATPAAGAGLPTANSFMARFAASHAAGTPAPAPYPQAGPPAQQQPQPPSLPPPPMVPPLPPPPPPPPPPLPPLPSLPASPALCTATSSTDACPQLPSQPSPPTHTHPHNSLAPSPGGSTTSDRTDGQRSTVSAARARSSPLAEPASLPHPPPLLSHAHRALSGGTGRANKVSFGESTLIAPSAGSGVGGAASTVRHHVPSLARVPSDPARSAFATGAAFRGLGVEDGLGNGGPAAEGREAGSGSAVVQQEGARGEGLPGPAVAMVPAGSGASDESVHGLHANGTAERAVRMATTSYGSAEAGGGGIVLGDPSFDPLKLTPTQGQGTAVQADTCTATIAAVPSHVHSPAHLDGLASRDASAHGRGAVSRTGSRSSRITHNRLYQPSQLPPIFGSTGAGDEGDGNGAGGPRAALPTTPLATAAGGDVCDTHSAAAGTGAAPGGPDDHNPSAASRRTLPHLTSRFRTARQATAARALAGSFMLEGDDAASNASAGSKAPTKGGHWGPVGDHGTGMHNGRAGPSAVCEYGSGRHATGGDGWGAFDGGKPGGGGEQQGRGGEEEGAGMGGPGVGAGAGGGAGGDVEVDVTLDAVLHVDSPEKLEWYLQLILDNPAPELVTICDRVANAVTVFGMDGLVMRLWPIVGSQSGEAGWGAQGGVSMGATSFRSLRTQGSGGRSHHGAAAVSRVGAKANFHNLIAKEYNVKWRLLSALIDANCRYAFPLLYALFFLLIVWIKVWSNHELDEGPSPQRSALGLQN